MRLSWNEIRVRAAAFADKHKSDHYEKGETQTFYNEFFEVFGMSRRRVAVFEQRVDLLDNKHGFVDLFWPGELLVEHKSAGRDLASARDQALGYFHGLKESEVPRFLLLSDFQTFELVDLETRKESRFSLKDLPKHVRDFGFIIGVEERRYDDQPEVNIKASELLGAVHDALEESGYRGHDLEQYLVRLLFCMFADDTGIFERGLFESYLRDRTKPDGSDFGALINELFEVLNTDDPLRQNILDEDLQRFPYVNGDLFRDRLRPPSFDSKMRERVIEAAGFDWNKVSPAIFGALFQSVMDKAERRKTGAHYTSEQSIMKVIGPLFLDDLRTEFESLKSDKSTRRSIGLEGFRRRLGTLTFLDPACGCGNFLVIAYRELRRLELDVLKELRPTGQLELEAKVLSSVDVDQFHGIEFYEFPARIAEVAMWMMDHIMNNELSDAFGQVFTRIPLRKSPRIAHKDALEFDWNLLLPSPQCSFVFGNPPFIGAKFQTDEQRQQVRAIAQLGGSGGSLDYVAAWFIKAGEYVNQGRGKIAFVATNSICQGEQVAQLWPILFDRLHLEIAFAHRTFAWYAKGRGMAHVHVVIVGLTRADMEPNEKRLFSYDDIKGDPVESKHVALSPYLFDAANFSDRHLVVREENRPINGARPLVSGTQPLENDFLTFDDDAKRAFVEAEPNSSALFRPFPGAFEFINGVSRWILHTDGLSPSELAALPYVSARLRSVREFRAASSRPTTRALSGYPSKYGVTVVPTSPFLVMPQVSSERREYAPIGWLSPPSIPSEKLRILLDASVVDFGILTSTMHMAWTRAVSGRLKSDYMYSVGVVYNTFPWPDLDDAAKQKIGALAQAVLDARARFSGSTLAQLYDPDLMPPDLRKAHHALDLAVDRLYRKQAFASERERVEHLFMLYEKMIAPIVAAAAGKPKWKRRVVN